MKKINLRSLLIIVIISLSEVLCAQRQIKILRDCVGYDDTNTNVHFYCNSTFEVTECQDFVRVMSVDTNFVETNKNKGIISGTWLKCTQYNDDLTKVRFTDNTNKERFNVEGVVLEVFKFVRSQSDGKGWYIPYISCKEVENVRNHRDVKEDFSYKIESHELCVSAHDNYNVIVDDRLTPCVNGKNIEIKNVRENARIKVVLSNANDSYLDLDICVSDIRQIRNQGVDDDSDEDFFINNYWLVALVCFMLLLLIWMLYELLVLKKKKSAQNKDKNQQETNNKHKSEMDETSIKKDIQDVKSQVSIIVKQLESIDKALESCSQKKDINVNERSKDAEIVQLKKEKSNLNNDLEKSHNTNKDLQKKILELEVKLRDAMNIEGVITLNGTADFVAKTMDLINVGRKAEKTIIDYLNKLSESDVKRFAYFTKKYVSSIEIEKRDKWNSILSTLSIKGYISDTEAIKYLSAKGCESDEAKLDWLKKFIYEEYLKQYISALIVMLESIRFSKQYGVTLAVNNDVSNAITELISASNKIGIKVNYIQLGKDVEDYSEIEIHSKLPEGVEYSGDSKAPILVTRYGLLSDKSTKSSKTEIIILD